MAELVRVGAEFLQFADRLTKVLVGVSIVGALFTAVGVFGIVRARRSGDAEVDA